MLRYGIPEVDPDRRICFNCQHWQKSGNPKSGWGSCRIGLNGGLFRNHTSHGVYMAYHTDVRYYTNVGCKVRFRKKGEQDV